MALTVIKSARKTRRFLAYDAEWIPRTLEIRMVGCFDGSRYRAYRSFADFLDNELTSKNRGAWFYAHAGGFYDVQWVLEHIVKMGGKYSFKASFNGSSATVVHVKRGKNVWHFVDSYWLLRDKLANIGKVIGINKTGPTDSMTEDEKIEWFATVPFDILRDYNATDCEILWRAIDMFETALLGMGGQLQMTLASCAMQLFRRRYLKSDVETADSVNEFSRESYFASRVEVFCRESFDSNYYDINSSFPFAMTEPVPGAQVGAFFGLPDRFLDFQKGEGSQPFLSDVEFEIPECYLPPMPIRADGRVFFPTGRWRSWINDIDLHLLLSQGGRIIKAHRTLTFEPFMDLARYARDVYDKRKSCDNEFERTVYKLLLNSLYGKFAESDEKIAILYNPESAVLERLRNAPNADYLFPGCWQESVKIPIPHMHVPISSAITARARRTLYRFLSCSDDYHYCDTDGFSTGDFYDTGPELGELKLERTVKHGLYIAPKLYRLDDKVKAKGFSLGSDSKVAITRFERLVEEKEFEIVRMSRIRENFRRGIIVPNEAPRVKRINVKNLGKRFMYPDGHTRPWSIDELEDITGVGLS